MTIRSRATRRLAALGLLLFAAGSRAELVHMGYVEEFYVDQGPGHFTFDFLRAAEMIVVDSGVAVEWMPVPASRMSFMMGRDDYPFCMSGASVTSERVAQGQFTSPYAYDGLIALVGRSEDRARLGRARSFVDFAAANDATFLAHAVLNYGPAMTDRLKSLGSRVSYELRSVQQMVDMVAAKRADFALLPRTYAQNFLATRKDSASFVVLAYPDMRRGVDVAIWCNRAVSATAMARFDASIARQAAEIRNRFPLLARD